ncbi:MULTISPECIES: DASS family sodium-coupled anion symporter [Brevibacterium]|uniref:Sodium-dependent dicarboxylate transporter SdcS n=1 Tax=Brevibacterium antiquum CNRZ 918 TaxID=1255637 RepID=A0A2H1KA42_9MICO|nr:MULTISPECIES: DASS family sodium-coupled anion symporter [Brevibacterium]SMX96677.1 solute carrier family 13 (sodium-dependent dicarboxylate transporter), member 2/3/5 [Brevibacterium antiquum CNRZ 918]HCG55800.1 carboxylate transporter [Brevibacterium sp.]
MTQDKNSSTGGSTEVGELSPGERAPRLAKRTVRIRWTGFLLGLILSTLVYAIMPGDLDHGVRLTAAIAVLMAAWWMTEALPIAATALVPLVAFPVLGTDIEMKTVGASYGNPIIFLFLGGFLIALAMQRWNLHRRIALVTLSIMGNKPGPMIAGFMIATGFVSMWVSNTATAVMMLPIGISVLMIVSKVVGGAIAADADRADSGKDSGLGTAVRSNFGTALMLGIAYSASIGSLGTIIGTPPNLFLVGYLEENHDISIGFGQWMLVGVPLSIVMMIIAWFLLVKVLFKPEIDEIPGGRELIRDELKKLGPMSTGEKLVLAMFILAAVCWITQPLIFDEPPISDEGIAMAIGLLLFLIPGGANRGVKLLDWDTAENLPWGVLLLFGGGLALSAQFSSSGLTEWIGKSTSGLGVLPTILIVAIFATIILFLTELTSNTATAATFIPVVGGVAMGLDLDPLLLTIPVALAATCAFMLPVATPPNAVAYGSGYVTVGQMIKGGVLLNVIGIVLITATVYLLAIPVFNIML